MKARISPQAVRRHAIDVLNRCDPPKESVDALFDLATRIAGYDPYPGLAALDLESDVSHIAEQIQYVFRELPPPVEVTYLLVGTAAYFESATARPIHACYLSGQTELSPDDLDAVLNPAYSAHRYQIQSALLDGVVQQNHAEDVDELVAGAVLNPATGVLFRAAVRQLGLPYTVVVTSDDVDPYPFVLKRSSSSD